MRSSTWIFAAAAIALWLPGMGHAQAPAAPPKKPPQPAAAASQKVIKDADEFNAYMKALNTGDPAQKAAAMEAFAARYPKGASNNTRFQRFVLTERAGSGARAKVSP